MQATIVFVPGLRSEMPQHWQTLLAEQLAAQGRAVRAVPPLEVDSRLRRARVASLDRVLNARSVRADDQDLATWKKVVADGNLKPE